MGMHTFPPPAAGARSRPDSETPGALLGLESTPVLLKRMRFEPRARFVFPPDYDSELDEDDYA